MKRLVVARYGHDPMSSFGPPTGPHAGSSLSANQNGSSFTTQYSRVDLQAAFNWLVNQPDAIRKQASDPDRLMTLYYRSSSKPNPTKTDHAKLESDAPVSSQNFISDLRQINEALRQFESPSGYSTQGKSSTNSVLNEAAPATTIQTTVGARSQSPAAAPSEINAKTLATLQEVKEKLNLSSDVEALQMLVALGYRQLKPLIG